MNRRTSRAQAKLLRFSAAAAPGASSVANTQPVAAFLKAAASSFTGEHTAERLDWGASSCSASGASTHGADVGAFAVRSADAAWTSSLGSLADSVVIPSGDAVVRSTASAVIADVAVPIAVANVVCSTPATAPQASTASSPSSAVMLFVGPASELLVVAKQLGAGLWAPSLSSSKSSSTRMDVRKLESRLLFQKPLRCMKYLATFQGTQWLFAQLLASWIPV
mmetsp:Transcript_59952/g.195804  ORF Transcript_59952/g.195804 Transcript_59952/m.195804 type:complete len:222 (-) Transcript_59952:89-754(-)